MNDSLPPAPPRPTPRPVRELAAALAVLATLGILAHLAAGRWERWQTGLAALGAWAPVIYLALWLVIVPCGFPAAALGLTAGLLFGTVGGSLWAAAGLALSGLLMHALGRRWLRPRVARFVATRPRLTQLERAVAGGGFGVQVLARLSPLNYALTSYILAAGGAPAGRYLAGLVGALPGLVAYVWLGAAAAAGLATDGPARTARTVVALIGGLGLLGLAYVLARLAGRLRQAPPPGDRPPR